ncbi:MAG: sigma factor-like helix-turn-helix DNA-binding protein [Mycobacterium sp.]
MDEKLIDPELLGEAWNQLQPWHRELIRKAHYQGWTTRQIAADLNVAEPIVKAQLHYALHSLRLNLTDPTLRSRTTLGRNSSGGTP